MPIKVKLRGNKAIVRFNNPAEEHYFRHIILTARDDFNKPHPKISIKGPDGRELPPLKPPTKVMPVKPEMVKPSNVTIDPKTGSPVMVKK